MKLLLAIPALVTLTACAQSEPICDYDRPFSKLGTVEDTCPAPIAPITPIQPVQDEPERKAVPPTSKPPYAPPAPPTEPPSDGHKDNGFGNEDDKAPGNSLGNNRAENEVGNPGHKSGKPQNSN